MATPCHPSRPSVLALGLLLLAVSAALADAPPGAPKTCFNIDGSVSLGSFRCNNATTGHSTCCQPGAICYSNNVCLTLNNGIQDYQRVGCTDHTFNDPACLKECAAYAPYSSAGIRPCDGIESGLHYCCDTGEQGIGSYACCNDPSSIFTLGTSLPTVLASMPASEPVSSTSMASTATSSSSSTTTGGATNPAGGGNATDGSGGSNSGATAVGLGVGLGLGIPLGVAVAGAIWFLARRRRKAVGGGGGDGGSPLAGSYAVPSEMDAATNRSVAGGYAPSYYQQGSGGGGGGGSVWHGSTPSPGTNSAQMAHPYHLGQDGGYYHQQQQQQQYPGAYYHHHHHQQGAIELPIESSAMELPAPAPTSELASSPETTTK